jgi:hypothetical protein
MKKILAIGLIFILALSLLTACGDNGGENTAPPASDNGGGTQSTDGSAANDNLPPDTRVIAVGQTFERNGITVTLDEVWVSTYTKNNPERLPEGHVFLFPHFTITNMNEGYKDKKKEDILNLSFSSIDGCIAYIGGVEYKRIMDALMSYDRTAARGTKIQMDVTVYYGETEKVFNAFIVPENWDKVEFAVSQMTPDGVVSEKLNFSYEVENK